ncbi:MAG: hypothetical protein EOM08_12450 [Clostridia bacterium]|nr:hypothetical protein [Clostridia bacterium]NCC77232.1 hypothetical protein [Clostridia bacterium]
MGQGSVTIARANGSEASVSIQYATQDGTAQADTHYAATTGRRGFI